MTSKKHIQKWASSALLTAAKAIEAVSFALERLAYKIKRKSLSLRPKTQKTSNGIPREQIAEELSSMIMQIAPRDLPFGEREKHFNDIATDDDMRRLELAAEWKVKAKKYDSAIEKLGG
ncbi:MAG: hypothetical protein HRU18_18265 [Pseudoalteromonas sp.]|uniref:hypothetical protein n=1 Tax=Pseudoalteromonas sp. TaxID=53249 RepID=UPI001D84E04F|nr:hypothetical protein [Pseudoalteromonas sp.]NRA80149.1 hypothetical protein [Pseudoalteromonas sp.]